MSVLHLDATRGICTCVVVDKQIGIITETNKAKSLPHSRYRKRNNVKGPLLLKVYVKLPIMSRKLVNKKKKEHCEISYG